MSDEIVRRSFLRNAATVAAGAGVIGGSAAASSGSNTSISGGEITATVREEGASAVPAEIEFGRQMEIEDVQTAVWDGRWNQLKATGPDAATSSVSRPSESVPELELENTLQFVQPTEDAPRPIPKKLSYTGTVNQRLLTSATEDALLIDSDVQFQTDYYSEDEQWRRQIPHTAYTVWDPEFSMWAPGTTTHDRAYRTTVDGYDVVIVGNGRWHAAYARSQHQQAPENELRQLFQDQPTDQQRRSFDGCRMGLQGSTAGSEKSAWQDIYGEADGWIDSNDGVTVQNRENRGQIDVGVGTYAGTDPEIRWTEAFGFGDTGQKAASAATAVLDAGYDAERANW